MQTEKYRIILIEDQQSHADYIASILNSNTFDIRVFNDGKTALKYLKKPECIPDLILVDNILPDMEGIEIIKYFVSRGCDYAFVLLTGVNSVNLAVNAIKSGASDYISKSLDLKEELEFVIIKNINLHKERLAKKALENKLKERESQLVEIAATKEKLFSIIAHDLKSPFTSIIGFTDLLIRNIKKYDIEKIEKLIKMVNSTAENTLVLLENLLNWANSQTGKVNIKYETIDLSLLIKEIIEISNSTAKLKNISINYLQTDNLIVYADMNMLETILLNLISNSIKFTKSSGQIDISAKPLQNCVEISVSDNGVGMDSETRERLFKLESNISTKGTAGEKGSGVGLILCKDFVEKLGGKIWVESEIGKGSDFIFTIPIK